MRSDVVEVLRRQRDRLVSHEGITNAARLIALAGLRNR